MCKVMDDYLRSKMNDVAINLKNEGVSAETIARAMNVPVEQIENIGNEKL